MTTARRAPLLALPALLLACGDDGGRDTDTTACIAGGIAGLRCGLTQLPTALVQGLRGQTEWLAPLQQQLLCYWRDQ